MERSIKGAPIGMTSGGRAWEIDRKTITIGGHEIVMALRLYMNGCGIRIMDDSQKETRDRKCKVHLIKWPRSQSFSED